MKWQRIAYGEMRLRPGEFWNLTAGQFLIMMEGLNERMKREQGELMQVLHLLRYPAAQAIAASTDSGKASLRDVMYIPEIDDKIEALQKQKKKEQDARDEQIWRKYKVLEGLNARRSYDTGG